MRRCVVVLVVALLCSMPLAVLSQEVITGEKFNALRVSPDRYMNVPVVLEGTFENIVENFNKIEIGNNYTSGTYVKFMLGQSPYPCIGMRTTPVINGLEKCGPGDLVRVTGNLKKMQEKPKRVRVRGKYTSGPSYSERIHIYGPKEREIFFNVSSVEKGWGKKDSTEEMFEEGKSLKEVHYKEVKPGDTQLERDRQVEKLVDQAIWFEGKYEGIEKNLTDLEKAAGITADNIIKFKVNMGDKTVSGYIPYSKANLEGFENLPIGTEIQVYGRIRKKETPKGTIAGFLADRVMKVVIKKGTPPSASEAAPSKEGAAPVEKKEEGESAVLPAEVAPPPAP